jgi:hypothetical protein
MAGRGGLNAIPVNFSRYVLSTMGYDLPVSESPNGCAMVYAKLPRFAIFGVARRGKGFPLISGTRLPMRNGRFGPRGYKISVSLLNFIFEKARAAQDLMASLSPNQRAKIQESMQRDPKRV